MPKDLSSRQVPTGRSDSKEPKPRTHKSFNVFPALSHKHLTSQRYGDISLFFYFYGTRGDKIPLNTKQDIGTFTLQSPVESDIYTNKTYIKVNHQALYPTNWELMRTEKQRGDDVPDHMRMEFSPECFSALISSYISKSISYINDAQSFSGDVETALTNVLKGVFALESILSRGSLLSMSNIHVSYSNSLSKIYDDFGDFDTWFDTEFMSSFLDFHNNNVLSNLYIGIPVGKSTVYYGIAGESTMKGRNYYRGFISMRYAVELMRNMPFTLSLSRSNNIPGSAKLQYIQDFIDSISIYFDDSVSSYYENNGSSIIDTYYNSSVNIECVGAYQLACAHFFTDDKIDNVYTSDLWFDAFKHQISLIDSDLLLKYYTMNGIKHYYDCFNGVFLFELCKYLVSSFEDSFQTYDTFFYNIIRMLFGIRKSLKFGDYFTSARTNLLSGDENEDYKAIVNGDSVSAVRLARSQQYTRFRHNVNLSGSRLSDYLSGIFGGPLLEAERDKPQWLAQQSFRVRGYQVENTGTAQSESSPNIITTILNTSNEKFSFRTFVDDQCIILGLQTYDVDRIYANSVDRNALHFDRYDDFIPQLQFVGDQDITTLELFGLGNAFSSKDIPFAYTERYAEYKRRVSYASGAYIGNLPSYAFISDNTEGTIPRLFIDSDFIRSSNVEFDRFFASLTGWSLASYFHFRVKSTHDLTDTKRNMVKHPQIFR